MRWTKMGGAVLSAAAIAMAWSCTNSDPEPVIEAEEQLCHLNDPLLDNAVATILDGQQTFRFDTFGDEFFWGDQLGLHLTIEGKDHGGIGPGLSPATALALGLKVDVDALPGGLKADLKHNRVNL